METTVQCPPINTARLDPVRQQLNKICISISDSGQVTLEVKSRAGKSSDNSQFDKTKELICISPDGMQIEVYKSAEYLSFIDGCPVLPQPGQVYTYPNMPDRIWKKYQHAYKFVEVIKSVTPKVTLLTDRARCKLMENCPNANFQACFHNGVILLFSEMKVTLTEQDGSSLTFHEDLAGSYVSSNTMALLEYSLQCRDQCLKIEKSVSSLQSNYPQQDIFPLVIGTNNQPYQLSLNEHKLSTAKPETSSGGIQHSSDMRATIRDQGHVLQPQNNVNTERKNCKQAAGSEESQKQIQETIGVFHGGFSECPHPQNHLYPLGDKSDSATNFPNPWEPSGFQNFPQSLRLQSPCSSKEACDWSQGTSASSEDFSGSNSSSSNSISHSARATSVKSDKAASLYSDSCTCRHTDLSHDAMKQTIPAKIVNCEDQLPGWASMPGHVINAGLINKFQSECRIPGNLNDSHVLSENSCNESLCENERLKLSSARQTCLCIDTHSQPNQLTCLTNMPDSCTTQCQKSFLTPQRSQVACNSYRGPSSDGGMRCRHKTPVIYDSDVDERQLNNVKRNLFSDLTSEEPKSSPLPSSPSNVIMQGMINFSDCCSSDNLVYQNTELPNLTQPRPLDNILPQTGVSAEDSLPNVASQLTSGKVPLVTKSIVRNSQCSCTPAGGHTESLALPLCSETSSVPNSTRSINLSLSEDANSTENSNLVNTHSAVFVEPATQLQLGTPFSENNTSPRKSTPLRKVACLSPHKTAAYSNQRNRTLEYTETVSGDFQPLKYQTDQVNINRSSPGSSTGNSINNYQIVQSLDNLINPVPDFDKPAFKSCPGMPLSRDFPPISPSSHNWNSLDLPFSRHIQHSLDVSSDDHSSSPPSSTSDVICQLFVPYTGWALLYASGTVWILYNDGTQLGVKSTEATVTYVGQDGSRARYNNTDVIPEIVKMKLEKLPKVIELIRKSQDTGLSGIQLWQS